MPINRKYPCRDVDLLMTSRIIAEVFRSYLPELSSIRPNWTEEYANALISKIDHAIGNYLGIDAKKDLRNASAALNGIQVPARKDVSFFKTQVDADFRLDKARRDDILKALGFDKSLKKIQSGSQEALIELLFTFRTNLSDALRKELTGKGISPALIDRIAGYADVMQKANATQEELKTSTKGITRETQEIFNGIYLEIMAVCRIAAAYYRYDPLKKEQFTFKKVLNNLGAARKVSTPTPAA